MKIISFSLWGQAGCYLRGAVENARYAPWIYPGWICRFYCRDDVPTDTLQALRETHAQIVPMTGDDGMFWRFRPAGDRTIERFISRDTDSMLNLREKAAVQDWMESGKEFHIMRDHRLHRQPIMGGMWGCIGGAVPNIEELIAAWPLRGAYNDDQQFLKDEVWPNIQGRFLCHDGRRKRTRERLRKCRPFPKHPPIEYGAFVGDRVW